MINTRKSKNKAHHFQSVRRAIVAVVIDKAKAGPEIKKLVSKAKPICEAIET